MTKRSSQLTGHGLWYEGAPHDDRGNRIGWPGTSGPGRAMCQCGALSETLPSGGARKRWHREVHKPEIAAKMNSVPGDTADLKDIHTWFGLTYSNYLVLPRTLLQSMPAEWQHRFITCIDELHDAFSHIEQATNYEVTASVECHYSDLDPADMEALGITTGDGDSDGPPDFYYDRDGVEHQPDDTLLLPAPAGDPVPHYNRGRTRIEPRI